MDSGSLNNPIKSHLTVTCSDIYKIVQLEFNLSFTAFLLTHMYLAILKTNWEYLNLDGHCKFCKFDP